MLRNSHECVLFQYISILFNILTTSTVCIFVLVHLSANLTNLTSRVALY